MANAYLLLRPTDRVKADLAWFENRGLTRQKVMQFAQETPDSSQWVLPWLTGPTVLKLCREDQRLSDVSLQFLFACIAEAWPNIHMARRPLLPSVIATVRSDATLESSFFLGKQGRDADAATALPFLGLYRDENGWSTYAVLCCNDHYTLAFSPAVGVVYHVDSLRSSTATCPATSNFVTRALVTLFAARDETLTCVPRQDLVLHSLKTAAQKDTWSCGFRCILAVICCILAQEQNAVPDLAACITDELVAKLSNFLTAAQRNLQSTCTMQAAAEALVGVFRSDVVAHINLTERLLPSWESLLSPPRKFPLPGSYGHLAVMLDGLSLWSRAYYAQEPQQTSSKKSKRFYEGSPDSARDGGHQMLRDRLYARQYSRRCDVIAEPVVIDDCDDDRRHAAEPRTSQDGSSAPRAVQQVANVAPPTSQLCAATEVLPFATGTVNVAAAGEPTLASTLVASPKEGTATTEGVLADDGGSLLLQASGTETPADSNNLEAAAEETPSAATDNALESRVGRRNPRRHAEAGKAAKTGLRLRQNPTRKSRQSRVSVEGDLK